jgi:Fe-S cluster assembly protein SufB
MKDNIQQRKTNASDILEQEVQLAKGINEDYNEKYGFKDDHKNSVDIGKGINEEIIRQISKLKNEDQWMLDLRLRSYKIFLEKQMPNWGGDLSEIDFDNIHYFVRATDKQGRSWDEVPDDIKDTFDKLGIPQAERKFLAGVATQYESEVVYHNLHKKWNDLGIIFLDTDSAYKEYPEIFHEYFGKIIPPTDNKFAALNTAVWSGGSFIYVPKGVKVEIPLQAYL